jgi:hypothetical protein
VDATYYPLQWVFELCMPIITAALSKWFPESLRPTLKTYFARFPDFFSTGTSAVTYLSNQFTLLYNSQSQFPVLGV